MAKQHHVASREMIKDLKATNVSLGFIKGDNQRQLGATVPRSSGQMNRTFTRDFASLGQTQP